MKSRQRHFIHSATSPVGQIVPELALFGTLSLGFCLSLSDVISKHSGKGLAQLSTSLFGQFGGMLAFRARSMCGELLHADKDSMHEDTKRTTPSSFGENALYWPP